MLKTTSELFEKIGENVEFIPMDFLDVSHDVSGANEILSISDYTQSVNANYDHVTRRYERLEGTYKIKVQSENSYLELVRKINEEKEKLEIRLTVELRKLSREMAICRDEQNVSRETILRETYENTRNKFYKGKDYNFTITFDEWKNNRLENGGKLSKELSKRFDGQLLEFYNAQDRNDINEVVYFTITSKAVHIAGMSYFSNGNWDGMNGSSCMNPENEYFECSKLGASLQDDKLFIGFLHDNFEDIYDFENKVIGRTVLRHISPKTNLVEDVLKIDRDYLIATKYYQDKDRKGVLDNALLELQKLNIGILSNEVLKYGDCTITESTNGAYEMEITDEIYIEENVYEDVRIDCPMCEGSGEYEVYVDRFDTHVEVTCPCCSGDGTVEVTCDVDISEYVEVIHSEELTPYSEKYSHYGNYMTITVNKEYFNRVVGNK